MYILWRQIYADIFGRRVARAAIGQQAAADYVRRYARWRLLTDKQGEWAQA